jgi:hypothetical protein
MAGESASWKSATRLSFLPLPAANASRRKRGHRSHDPRLERGKADPILSPRYRPRSSRTRLC